MTNPEREEILLDFASEPSHDRVTLERYLVRYPTLADDLVDLSLELRLQRSASLQSVPSDDEWAEASLKSFKAMLGGNDGRKIADPFARPSPSELVAIRKRLGIPSAVVHGLRARIVDAATIPVRFLEVLARELGSSVEALRAYLAQPPQVVYGLSYKSDSNPSVEVSRLSFDRLLRDARVPDEDRIRLLSD